MDETRYEETKKEAPKGPVSRGWVDDAIDAIAAAESKGVSLDSLPHHVQHTVRKMAARPEGERALGNGAHELDHVKQAHKFVKARLAQIVAGVDE